MKSRKESAKFVNNMFIHGESGIEKNNPEFSDSGSGYGCASVHIGLVEFRALFDFIYEGKPKSTDEELKK